MQGSSQLALPPLWSQVVEGRAHPGRRTVYALHGIYGRGRNWAGIARQLLDRRPDWRWLLIDLRGHGHSPDLPPPHTVAAAADDVARLFTTRGLPADAVLGHSFGGKVALELAASGAPSLRQVWVIDSTPAPKAPDGSAWHMLEAVRGSPGPFAAREDAASAIHAAGFSTPVAAWMASNATWQDGLYRWRLDFSACEALLVDFFRRDLWHVIEDPPDGLMVHVVKASDSTLLAETACARIDAAARRHGRVQLHRIHGGHWLHTDNPGAIIALLARELPKSLGAS